MTRFAVLLIVLALAACGGQEGDTSSAAQGEGAEAPAVEAGGAVGQMAGVAPVVKECLDLVKEAQFNQAIPVCLSAVQQHPESVEAKAALDQAQQGVAEAETLEAAAESLDEAAAEAEESAAEQAEKAGEALPEGVRQ